MGSFSKLFKIFLKEDSCNVCANELKPGDKVKDINPGCKEKNAKGVVKSIKKIKDGKNIAGNLIEFEVKNKGRHYKPGQKLKKTEIQLKKVSESFRAFITEGSLSKNNFNSRPPRIDTLIKKLENKEPFVKLGETEPTLVIDVDPNWLANLKATKRIETTYIPTINGEFIRFAKLQKTPEFGSYTQRGADFEEKFYNAVKDLLQEGEFKLRIKDKEFIVKNIDKPAGQKNILADIAIETDSDDIFLSLKKNNFHSYGGITFSGRDYQKEVSELPIVKEFISKLRKYLKSIGKCVEKEGKLICDPEGKRYYLKAKYDQDFVDFVLFGDKKYKDDKDYVDYVVIEDVVGSPIFETQGDVYILNPLYTIKERGDKVDTIDEPVLLAKFRDGKMDRYGFLKNRNVISRRKFIGTAKDLNELI